MSVNSTQSDVQRIVNKLKRLPQEYQAKTLKKIYRKNAKPTISKAKSNIPKSAKTVKRYSNGKVVEEIKPGTLRRSIGILALRRTKSIFVGPRTGKGRKNDGWFGHFLENGTVFQPGIHYMKRAYNSTKNQVLSGITDDVKTVLSQYIRKNKIL